MRTYFTFSITPYSKFIDDPQLARQVESFSKKYMCIQSLRIELLWGAPIKMQHGYAYREGTHLYEFFSGLEIGHVASDIMVPEDTTVIAGIPIVSEQYGKVTIFPQPAHRFVNETKPLMRHHKTLARVMLQYFELHRLVKSPDYGRIARERERAAAKMNQELSTLERFLDKRK